MKFSNFFISTFKENVCFGVSFLLQEACSGSKFLTFQGNEQFYRGGAASGRLHGQTSCCTALHLSLSHRGLFVLFCMSWPLAPIHARVFLIRCFINYMPLLMRSVCMCCLPENSGEIHNRGEGGHV